MRRSLTALALCALGTAHAATVSVYNSLASWQAAVGGPGLLQDFSGDAIGTDLTGVQVLPGLTLSSNIGGNMHVFGDEHRAAAFGPARQVGNAYYEGTYATPFLAAALDIASFESRPGDATTAQDAGTLTFWFSDGSTQDITVFGNETGAAIFLGVVADLAITSFRWTEAHEGSGGNEETALDNFRVAIPGAVNELPLPGTLPLALLALGVVPIARRR